MPRVLTLGLTRGFEEALRGLALTPAVDDGRQRRIAARRRNERTRSGGGAATTDCGCVASDSRNLITSEQMAAQLGVNLRFVRGLREQRLIPVHKIGRNVRFMQADVDRYIDAARQEPPRW